MKKTTFLGACAVGLAMSAPYVATASSHMDAPLITFDDPANTTDVYAFLSEDEDGDLYLSTALSVYPFEEPGIGPNTYRFDDRVRYSIHLALGENVGRGEADFTYNFDFSTQYNNQNTVLQAFQGVIAPGGENQNLQQTYRVTKVDNNTRSSRDRFTVLGEGSDDGLIVPPNNQGLLTPLYNQGNDGDQRAKEGVSTLAALDPYTRSGVVDLRDGYVSFAGQRDDGFYADIQSIFDLDLSFGRATGTETKPFDSQGGFNVHTIVLNIPIEELGGQTLAGVYATTSRPSDVRSLLAPLQTVKPGTTTKTEESFPDNRRARFAQVGRQGNPLFVEALLPVNQKDAYNAGSPTGDFALAEIAANPELSGFGPGPVLPGLLESIYIPDLIKVDLTTGPARLSGEEGFDRLGVFGGDILKSEVQDPFGNGGFIPGGWPNGRRFGDDVVDIAVIALGLTGIIPQAGDDITQVFADVNVDRVDRNDITYNVAFPYAATPHNGRNHAGQDESHGE